MALTVDEWKEELRLTLQITDAKPFIRFAVNPERYSFSLYTERTDEGSGKRKQYNLFVPKFDDPEIRREVCNWTQEFLKEHGLKESIIKEITVSEVNECIDTFIDKLSTAPASFFIDYKNAKLMVNFYDKDGETCRTRRDYNLLINTRAKPEMFGKLLLGATGHLTRDCGLTQLEQRPSRKAPDSEAELDWTIRERRPKAALPDPKKKHRERLLIEQDQAENHPGSEEWLR